jgi:hypothetical protein
MDDGRWTWDARHGCGHDEVASGANADSAGLDQVQDAVCFVSLDVVRLGVIRSDSGVSRGADWRRRATLARGLCGDDAVDNVLTDAGRGQVC